MAVGGQEGPGRQVTCTALTERCATAKSYDDVLPGCCRGHIRQIMVDLQSSFALHGVTWWADYGTLLGAVRNPMTTKADYPWLDQARLPDGPIPAGVIPHDKDADLGCFTRDWRKLLKVIGDMMALGYDVRVRNNTAKFKVRISEVNHTNIDVFSWTEGIDSTLHRRAYIGVDRFKGKRFPAAWVDDLSVVEWEGLQIPAPNDPEAFCAFRYGPKWMTPIAANNDGVTR